MTQKDPCKILVSNGWTATRVFVEVGPSQGINTNQGFIQNLSLGGGGSHFPPPPSYETLQIAHVSLSSQKLLIDKLLDKKGKLRHSERNRDTSTSFLYLCIALGDGVGLVDKTPWQ